jgi:hypothetical protein
MSILKILRFCLYLLIAVAVIKGLYHLVSQAWYFFEGAYAGDAQYYWTVGRGMLNGRELYSDIFDTKPPGIYLLSALSLWIFGNGTLGFWLNALMVLVLPVLFCRAALRMAQSLPRSGRWWCVFLTGLFGIVLTLYSAFQAEAWQVEWYGSFFGVLYALNVASAPLKQRRWSELALGIFLFLAIGFKEPFFLSLLAVALLLLPTKRLLVQRFALPIAGVAIAGVVAMLVFGYLDGYISLYLPSQFGHHIGRSMPLWMRGMQLDLPVRYLAQFSVIFTVLIGALIVSTFIRSENLRRKLLIVIALYMTYTAANLRGYPVANHFVVAAPVYTAFFLLFLKKEIDSWGKHPPYEFLTMTLLSIMTVLVLPMTDGMPVYAQKLAAGRESDQISKEVAIRIDALLSACDIDQYFFVEEKPYMQFTQHSPANFFVYTGPESIVYHHPLLIEKQLQSFSTAKIVIAKGDAYEISKRLEEKTLSEMTFRYLANNFIITPWKCAEGLQFPEGYSVLFRKDVNTMKPFLFEMK